MTNGISRRDLERVFEPDLVLKVEKAARRQGVPVQEFVSNAMRPVIAQILSNAPDPIATQPLGEVPPQPGDPGFHSRHVTM